MNRRCIIFLPLFLVLFSSRFSAARAVESGPPTDEPLTVGNFALPTSQQPGPLVSFGQNIIDKNNFMFLFFADYIKGQCRSFSEAIPAALYGITDRFSIYFVAPFFISNKSECDFSSGIQDCALQFEYAFYVSKSMRSQFQATVVGNVTIPTGSSTKSPPTGFGSTSFFLGGTASYQALYWSIFTSQGAYLTTDHKGTKFGNQYLYQFGVEGIIANLPGWIFAWWLELDGYWLGKDRINNSIDCTSGSNTVVLTPSLFISAERIIVQLGVGVPIFQSVSRSQSKLDYSFVSSVGFTWVF